LDKETRVFNAAITVLYPFALVNLHLLSKC